MRATSARPGGLSRSAVYEVVKSKLVVGSYDDGVFRDVSPGSLVWAS